jgi:hypothetical protein
VRLRDVQPGDLDAYIRMRCDPAMMAELGGPLPADRMPAKVERDVVAAARAGTLPGPREILFNGKLFSSNEWVLDCGRSA